jgi:hypothetical protein
MGFKDVKKEVINCLNNGLVLHEARNDINIKNLLETGVVSNDDVINILAKSKGNEYSCSAHHMDGSIDVHIIKVQVQGINWYVKWYFSEPDSVFISVHN